MAEVLGRVKVMGMAKPDPEALARALRENLRKRKEQGRGEPPAPGQPVVKPPIHDNDPMKS